jgi:hypothetical protein
LEADQSNCGSLRSRTELLSKEEKHKGDGRDKCNERTIKEKADPGFG